MDCWRRHTCWQSRETAVQPTVSGFMVTGLVSGLPLASRSDSASFWCHAHLSATVRIPGKLARCTVSSLLWAGMSPLLSAPPEFCWLVFHWQHPLLYWDLLLWDNSGKLSSCLAKGGGFGQQLPNRAMNIRMHVSFWIISFVWIYAQKWDCWIIWQLYIWCFEELLYCFPEWVYQSTFPPTV